MTHHFHLNEFYTLFSYYDFICMPTPDEVGFFLQLLAPAGSQHKFLLVNKKENLQFPFFTANTFLHQF